MVREKTGALALRAGDTVVLQPVDKGYELTPAQPVKPGDDRFFVRSYKGDVHRDGGSYEVLILVRRCVPPDVDVDDLDFG